MKENTILRELTVGLFMSPHVVNTTIYHHTITMSGKKLANELPWEMVFISEPKLYMYSCLVYSLTQNFKLGVFSCKNK